MRESIGGALLIKIVMFFIVIYVCFLAITINYSITFRVKNQIINLLESYEGVENAREPINRYISEIAYYGTSMRNISTDPACQNGYCIEKIETPRGNYYKVTTYVSFDFPIFGNVTNFPITGETRIIYKQPL